MTSRATGRLLDLEDDALLAERGERPGEDEVEPVLPADLGGVLRPDRRRSRGVGDHHLLIGRCWRGRCWRGRRWRGRRGGAIGVRRSAGGRSRAAEGEDQRAGERGAAGHRPGSPEAGSANVTWGFGAQARQHAGDRIAGGGDLYGVEAERRGSGGDLPPDAAQEPADLPLCRSGARTSPAAGRSGRAPGPDRRGCGRRLARADGETGRSASQARNPTSRKITAACATRAPRSGRGVACTSERKGARIRQPPSCRRSSRSLSSMRASTRWN